MNTFWFIDQRLNEEQAENTQQTLFTDFTEYFKDNSNIKTSMGQEEKRRQQSKATVSTLSRHYLYKYEVWVAIFILDFILFFLHQLLFII